MSKLDGSAEVFSAGSSSESTSTASSSKAEPAPYAEDWPPARVAGPSGATTPVPSEPDAGATPTSAAAAGLAATAVCTSAAVEVIAPEPSVARLTVMALPATLTASGAFAAPGSAYSTEMSLPPAPDDVAV